MSRSYKRTCSTQWACGKDTYCRKAYSRNYRRKANRLLKEEEKIDYSVEEEAAEYTDFFFDEDFGEFLYYAVGGYSNYLDMVALNNKGIFIDADVRVENGDYERNKYISERSNFINRPSEKIVLNRRDFSLKYSDKYSWISDGGTYFGDDIYTLRDEFEREVFGIDRKFISKYSFKFKEDDIWKKYLKCAKTYKAKPYKYVYVDFLGNLKERIHHEAQPKGVYGFENMLFTIGKVPRDFTEPEQLINWLRKNENSLIRKWLKAKKRK